jgi:hypothetical protein
MRGKRAPDGGKDKREKKTVTFITEGNQPLYKAVSIYDFFF